MSCPESVWCCVALGFFSALRAFFSLLSSVHARRGCVSGWGVCGLAQPVSAAQQQMVDSMVDGMGFDRRLVTKAVRLYSNEEEVLPVQTWNALPSFLLHVSLLMRGGRLCVCVCVLGGYL